MPLKPGSRLGPYEVLAMLGAGGMGEVWRARDSRIGREVAIKVLPTEFASDSDRLRRLEREARMIGALNHPNLLTLYDIGSQEGTTYLVTEMLEGETLRARIAQGPLSLKKAVDYAAQVTRALAAVHAKGIIHRDLKPENLFLLRDGQVKILDFGLARADAERSEAADTRSLTGDGRIVGTVGYMAPEQVRGEHVDQRADLFALGCVLYEMVSGRRAFGGTESVGTLYAVLHEEPASLSDQKPEVPAALSAVVQHCLEKDPALRFQSARDVLFALENLVGNGSSARTAAIEIAPPRRLRAAFGWGVGVLAIVAAAAASIALRTAPPQQASFERLTFRRGTLSNARFSPDGATIVYSAAWNGEPMRVYSTRIDSRESSALALPDARLLAVSSGGELAIAVGTGMSIAAGAHRTLARVSLAGGAPREVTTDVVEADWSPDGREFALVRELEGHMAIEFPAGREIWRSSTGILNPRVSPSGSGIAFIDVDSGSDFRGGYVAIVDRAGRKRRLTGLWEMLQGIAWSPRGDEVWFTGSHVGRSAKQLWAVSMSGRERLLLRTPGGITLQDVARNGQSLLTQDNSRASLLVRAPDDDRERDLSWQDLTGLADLSPDGRQLLFTEFSEAYGTQSVIGMRGTDGSPVVNLGEGYAGGLSPNGKWVVAIARAPRKHLSLLPTGTGERRDLDPGPLTDIGWSCWVPDGHRVAFGGTEGAHGPRVYVQDVTRGPPRAITPEGIGGGWHMVSPDSKYVLASLRDSSFLFPLDGGASRFVPGFRPGDDAIGWLPDGRAILVCDHQQRSQLPLHVARLDVSTGERRPVRDLMPPDPAGVTAVVQIMFSPDQQSWAYTYFQTLSDLYLARGLH